MTIDTAFAELLNNKELCMAIGMSQTNYWQMSKRFRDKHKKLTEQVKMFWLRKAGYKLKTMDWESPKKTKNKQH